jgi:hypothetical protein
MTGILLLNALAIYLIPCFVAFKRSHPQQGSIIIINILLGWTFIGWVVALAWACSSIPEKNNIVTPA